MCIRDRAILRCVAEPGQRFGAGLIAAVLCGGENEKIRRYRLERERTYGALAALSQREVQDRIRFLVDEHILELTDGQYPVCLFYTSCWESPFDVRIAFMFSLSIWDGLLPSVLCHNYIESGPLPQATYVNISGKWPFLFHDLRLAAVHTQKK